MTVTAHVMFCLFRGMCWIVDVVPVISIDAKKRIEGLIQTGVDEGCDLLLDGRGIQVHMSYINQYNISTRQIYISSWEINDVTSSTPPTFTSNTIQE